jgi:hypothetical protein
MSATAAPGATLVADVPPSTPRLVLNPTRTGRAVLDGGWWPRSWDPLAELPGLVLALSAWYRPIAHLMLSSDTWDGRFRRLAVGPMVVRIGWFSTQSPAVLIAITNTGDQIDILVVPPQTPPDVADLALAAAADPADGRRAPEILAAFASPVLEAADGRDATALGHRIGHVVASASPTPV